MTHDLTAERTLCLSKTRDILGKARADNRDLTANAQVCLEGHMAEIRTFDTQIKGRNLVTSVMNLAFAEADAAREGGGNSIFPAGAKAAIVSAIKSRTAYRTDLNAKAVRTTGSLLRTNGSTVTPGLHPNSQFRIASLFASLPAEGPSQRYYRTTAGVAGIVLEGAAKPDAGVVFTAVDVLLQKLACVANFADEMSEDAPFLMSFLQAEMVAAVTAAENALILSTFNTTSGVLTGSGVAATVVDLVADAIGAQETISGVTPSAITAAPSAIATIRKSKASTSEVYKTDILSTSPTTLHGVPLVSTPGAAPATVWVINGSRHEHLPARTDHLRGGAQRHRLDHQYPYRTRLGAHRRRRGLSQLLGEDHAHLIVLVRPRQPRLSSGVRVWRPEHPPAPELRRRPHPRAWRVGSSLSFTRHAVMRRLAS